MSKQIARLAAAALALPVAAAQAYPEGAPWGSADPGAQETCASCHHDYDAIEDSPALSIEGLPVVLASGQSYSLTIRLSGTEASVAGFQLLATGISKDAGKFVTDDDTIEAIGASSRSTQPRRPDFAWALTWQAPDAVDKPVHLQLAAAAANDDQSPLGDTIHYRRFVIRAPSR